MQTPAPINERSPHEGAPEPGARRLAALASYGILDTPREPEFDDIAAMAAQACGTPIAYVGFIDARRQWFKAEIGYGVAELAPVPATCIATLGVEDALVLPDLAEASFPQAPSGLRFYAGVALKTSDGLAIGTIAVLDRLPRELAPQQLAILRALARMVMAQLDMRKAIAAQALAEARLLESEDHYRHTVELNPQVPWTCDPQGGITSYSQRWLELTGQKPGEPDGAGWIQALHPDDLEHTIAHFTASLTSGAPVDVDYRIFVARTGTHRWMRARAQPRRNAEGEIIRWYGVVEDVHDRKLAEAELRDSEVRYRTLFDSIDVGFCIIAFLDGPYGPLSDYVHVEANAAFEQHTGFPNGVGRTAREMIPDEADGWVERYRDVLLTGEPIRFERELVTTGRYLELAAFRVEPASRRQVAVLFQDTTARKTAEAALQHLNETLEARVIARTAELAAAQSAAVHASKAKSDFLAAMSHEIRTPLNAVIGYTDLLLDDRTLQAESRERIVRIQHAGSALLTVVNDILDFSKVEAGQIELAPRAFRLDLFVDNAISIVRGLAQSKQIALDATIDVGTPNILLGDEDRLRQIVLNLLNNAVKFTPAGSVHLAVSCSLQPNRIAALHVRVSDTGIGIPEDKRSRLFKRFSQVDSSTARDFGGTGLGLAICKSLVELMGGTIGAEASPTGGSVFWFKVAVPYLETMETASATKPDDAAKARTASILVVEDVEVNQDIARAVLERAGHRVHIVGDGADAVAAVQQQPFDVVLMDIQMPGMDGLTATRLIRELAGPVHDIPVVAMTANVLPAQIIELRAAGMDDHVGKPFKRQELYATVDRWAAGRRPKS